MRLNEHVLHTWDIEVVDEPTSTLPQQAAALVVDNLELIARFTARPTGDTRTITITTTEPDRGFTIDVSPDAVQLSPASPQPTAALILPAEAFVASSTADSTQNTRPPTPKATTWPSSAACSPGRRAQARSTAHRSSCRVERPARDDPRPRHTFWLPA
jgi:hypothetical protein